MNTAATPEELTAGRGYETLFVPALFEPWTKHVRAGAAIGPKSHTLDVACGSGVLARDVLAHTDVAGRVVGLDAAPGMIAAAMEIEPGIEWVVGVAEALPFDAETFDHVLSQFGMMFFSDRAKAVEEMSRVTKPGGDLAIAVWNSIDNNPAYRDIIAFLDEEVGKSAGDAVRMPFCLGDPTEVTDCLAKAGFGEIAVETTTEQASFPSPRTMVEVELRGWLPLFDINLSEEKIAQVLASSDTRLSNLAAPNGQAEFRTSAHIITGRKPK